jgi:hypothetical protein
MQRLKEDLEEEGESLVPTFTNPLIKLRDRLGNLRKTQERFLISKLHGASDAAAARNAGVAPQTAYEWKKNPEFRRIYDEVLDKPIEFIMESLQFTTARAMDKLSRLLEHPDLRYQMYAIDKIIQIGGLDNHTKKVEYTGRLKREDIDDIIDEIEKRQDYIESPRVIDLPDSGGSPEV